MLKVARAVRPDIMEALHPLFGVNWLALVGVSVGAFLPTYIAVSIYRHLRRSLRWFVHAVLIVFGLALLAVIAALVVNYGFDGVFDLLAGYFKSIGRQSPDLLLAAVAGLVLGAGLSRRRTRWK